MTLGPGHAAQAHDRHLEQPGLDRTDELRVLLDAVDQDDVVGLDRRPVGVYRTALGLADHDRFHAVVNGRPERLGRLAEVLEHLDLPRGRAAAVAAHGRQNERAAALLLHGGHDRGQHLDHAADPAAAGRDQHRLAGLDGVQQAGALQLLPGAARARPAADRV